VGKLAERSRNDRKRKRRRRRGEVVMDEGEASMASI